MVVAAGMVSPDLDGSQNVVIFCTPQQNNFILKVMNPWMFRKCLEQPDDIAFTVDTEFPSGSEPPSPNCAVFSEEETLYVSQFQTWQSVYFSESHKAFQERAAKENSLKQGLL
ncbi:Hypothetical predicted protein [Octopus vulgaris]|uniref:Uncharacterized protein n=1 Tax=Octopus vulgaris TaxID=6645 RepID=A0AA36BRF0_OCTVU|nr:Hypothetical predicted protein [Octopus vulgaris]